MKLLLAGCCALLLSMMVTPSVFAQATTATVHLTWTAGANATVYKINRKIGAAAYVNAIATVNAPAVSYNDAGLALGNTFCYTVTASAAGGDGPISNECCSAVFAAGGATGLSCSVTVP